MALDDFWYEERRTSALSMSRRDAPQSPEASSQFLGFGETPVMLVYPFDAEQLGPDGRSARIPSLGWLHHRTIGEHPHRELD